MKHKKDKKHFEIKQYSLFIISSILVFLLCFSLVIYKMIKNKEQNKVAIPINKDISFENLESLLGDDSSFASDKHEDESESTAKININTASLEELVSLKGIGEVKANAIIEHRKENGDFISIYELLEVEGIGEKTLENIKADIIV